jgi:CRISPR-associated protein Csd1
MLKQLVDYANSHDVEIEPGFKSKNVIWAVAFDSTSGFTGLVELGQPEEKRNTGQTFKKCPDLTQMELISGSETRSHFLVDTAEVVALHIEGMLEEKTKDKHSYFVSLLTNAGKTIPQLSTLARMLCDDNVILAIRQKMLQEKVKPTDKVTLQLDDEFPVDKQYWYDWWRTFRKTLTNERGKPTLTTQMRCFVNGDSVVPLKTHPKIEGLASVGGQPSGDVLIGFDKESFRSYGLEQSNNSAVSENAGNAYRGALNELIRNYSYKLAGTRVVHWFKRHIVPEDDPLAWLIEPPEIIELNSRQAAKTLLESIQTGKRSDLAQNYYYTLTLSGAGGRVMVRDWTEGQFEELVRNIDLWFGDLEIVQRNGNQSHSPKFLAVLSSTVRDLDELNSPVVAKLWQVAVHNEPLPYYILAQTLNRRKIEIIQDDTINRIGFGLIKAYHIRKYRKEGNITLAEMLKSGLNENFPSSAYQCGRLMAVLAELQGAALGDVGAGIVQRYYAAASTTPALVLGRLTRTSQFHLNKLEPGLSHWFEGKIAGIWNSLDKAPPRILTLEEQSLFALGYYQQLAAMHTGTVKSQNNKKDEKEKTDD